MVNTLRDLLGSTLTSGSMKCYQRAWAVFTQFINRFYSLSSPTLPISSSCLALFISYLCARKLAPSTVIGHVSAIGYVHKMKGFPDPSKAFLIRKLLTAVGRHKSSDIRLPITRNVLHELVGSLEHTNSSAWQRILFKAMFLVAFYGFFRLGELATKGSQFASCVLQYGSIHFVTEKGCVCKVKITISKFKHNSTNRPCEIMIDRQSVRSFCPVQSLIDYCNIRGLAPGPLFCFPDMRAITVTQFNTELRRCLTFCGLDSCRYKSHSFRIGAACYAAEQGFSDAQIRSLGRWKSDAFKLYIRPTSLSAMS